MERWGNKRYHSLDYALKERYGGKVVKLAVDGGFTCPNRDGSKGRSGCLYCSESGSGDFAGDRNHSVADQLRDQRALLASKWRANRFIAYFQSFSNTYAPPERLRDLYDQALEAPGIVGLAVATRPDLIDEKTVDLLTSYGDRLAWVELGLQSSHPMSMERLQLRYKREEVEQAVALLRNSGIDVVVHVIFGLPWETAEETLETIDYVNALGVQGIKIHMLHILKQTGLGRIHARHPFSLLSREAYISLVVSALGALDPGIVIHRLTGDGKKEDLMGPGWILNKRAVLNGIDHRLKERSIHQGIFWEEEESS